jgi:SAM-dependent methyltransferase
MHLTRHRPLAIVRRSFRVPSFRVVKVESRETTMRDQSSAAWADRFNVTLSAPSKGSVQQRIWREVFGDEYPEEADPLSYTTRSELDRIARELGVGPGQSFADLGCGRGGPGLWVARTTGADLVGIDVATAALSHAAERAARWGLDKQARFQEGEFAATGLPAGSMDAVMSIDALFFAPDKAAAAREIARVLRPGGGFIFTSWDCTGALRERPPQVDDHRPLLEAAGFAVEAYEETTDWERRHRAIAEGMLAAKEELAAELGVETADRIVAQQQVQIENLRAIRRRVLVISRKAP